MAEDDSEKTEDPTGKKLSNARDEGRVTQSQEIKIWAGLMGALVMVSTNSPLAIAGFTPSPAYEATI